MGEPRHEMGADGVTPLLRRCTCGHSVTVTPEPPGVVSARTYDRYVDLLAQRLDRELEEHRCPLS